MSLSWTFIEKHTPCVPSLAITKSSQEKALIHWVTWNRAIELTSGEACTFSQSGCTSRRRRFAIVLIDSPSWIFYLTSVSGIVLRM